MEKLASYHVERLFFKTKQRYDLYRFDANFTTIHPEVVRFLAEKGVKVVGTDAPSVDAVDDVTLQAHHAFREAQLYIIENLYLKDIEAGMYEFIGVPLAIQGGDASPIRAVVRKMK